MPVPAADGKLRIAQVAPLWIEIPPRTYGGIELVISLLTEELVRRGHEVTLFASADSRTRGKLSAVCDASVLRLMEENRAASYEHYANAAVAAALARAHEFDVLHFHVGCQWVPFRALTKAAALFTLHTYLTPDDEWILQRYPDAAIAGISRAQVVGLSQQRKVDVPVVHNACNFDDFQARHERGEYLAFLGRIAPEKNPLGAIEIARKTGMPLVMAGRPQLAGDETYFKTQIRPRIDGKAVRYIGPVGLAGKNELLRNAAALLFPVQWPEPFGLVMIEAMACGTPVVAHALGSVRELVDEGITGYSSASIEALSDLVPRALELDRRAVREHARKRFHFERMADDYLALYRSILRA